MRLHLLAALILAPLCACSMGPGGTYATPTGPAATGLAVAETPLLMAFRVPVCIARTSVLGIPAIASAIVPFSHSKEGSGIDYLSNNAQADCGPPYFVTATQVSTEP